MANNRNTYGQVYTVSIRKENLVNIAMDGNLNKKDLRTLFILLTELDGWNQPKSGNKEDPRNFTNVDVDSISDSLGIRKKEVKKILKKLKKCKYIERGSSSTVTNGYRFTF